MATGTDYNNIFDDNLDERMAKAIHEERKRRTQRDKRRKKRASRRKVALALIALIAAFCLCVGLAKILHSDVFDDEKEFQEFADDAFAADSVCPETDTDQREYHYSEGTSYAVMRGDWINGDTKSLIDEKIDNYLQQNGSDILIEAYGKMTDDIPYLVVLRL